MAHKGIFKDKKGRYYIHTTIKGKSCTIRGFNSYKEANDNFEYAINKWKQEHNILSNGCLFEDVANNYIEFVKIGRSPRTADRERTQIRTFWLPRFEGQIITYIYNYERLRIIYNDIKDSKELKDRKKHDIVYTFLQFTHYCYVHHYIPKDVFEETNIIFQPIKYTKSVEQERRVIPQCDLRAFLDTIRHESERDYILFALLVNCGLRVSELLGLCNDCFVDGKVIVKRQLTIRGVLSDKLKTNQSYRSIPLPKDLCDYFKKFELINKRFYKIGHTQFKRLLYKYEDMAKIPHYVPHEYRHSFCFYKCQRAENIADIVYISKISGHSVSVFLNTYANHLDKNLEEKFFN